MFKNKRKLWLATLSIFALLLVSGCQVSVDKEEKPGFRIFKVDKEKENEEIDSK